MYKIFVVALVAVACAQDATIPSNNDLAPEIDNYLEQFNEKINSELSKYVSEAAKECLEDQRQKAQDLAQETRVKVKACRDDNLNIFDGIRTESGSDIGHHAKQCVITNISRVCLNQIQSAFEQFLKPEESSKIFKDMWSRYGNFEIKVGECTIEATDKFTDNMDQVREGNADCLNLTDSLINLEI